VPTTADVRLSVVKQILSVSHVRYWVLEKVLAQSVEQIDNLEQLLSNSEGVWVNTPMRAMSWHRKIRHYLKNPLHATYGPGMWGIACNAIHYLDLLAWWTGESLQRLDTKDLQDWILSKRNGYWEVSGTLWGHYSGGSQLELTSIEGLPPSLLIQQDEQVLWRLDENSGKFTGSNNFSLLGKTEMQSEMTGRLVEQILLHGTCSLTPLVESIQMHKILISGLLSHWNESQKRDDILLPIT
jgi:hypothetical protein